MTESVANGLTAVAQSELQQKVTDVLDILISYGSNKIVSSADAGKVKDVAGKLGIDVDMSVSASDLLVLLKPALLDILNTTATQFSQQATAAIDGLSDVYGKETVLTVYPNLKTPQKVAWWLLVLTSIAVSAVLTLDYLKLPEVSYTDLLFTAGAPVIMVLAFCAIPIKSLAHASMSIGMSMVAKKLEKGSTAAAKKRA